MASEVRILPPPPSFLSKLLVAASFIIPMLLFNLNTAIIISIAWGLSLIFIFNFLMAKQQHNKPWHAVGEHLAIAILVIIATHYLGDLLARQ